MPEFCNNRVSFWPLSNLNAGAAASFALGQPDLDTVTPDTGGLSPTSISNPAGVRAFGNQLFVADTANNRVLGFFAMPTTTGAVPDLVLGQPDFVTSAATPGLAGMSAPLDVAFDGTRLAIIEFNNDRALIYNTVPTSNGAAGDFSLGYYFFPATPTSLNSPVGGAITDSKLFVADRRNNRLVVWNTLPVTGNEPPDAYLGQLNSTDRHGDLSLRRL